MNRIRTSTGTQGVQRKIFWEKVGRKVANIGTDSLEGGVRQVDDDEEWSPEGEAEDREKFHRNSKYVALDRCPVGSESSIYNL